MTSGAFTLPGAVEAAVETGAGLIVMHGWDAAKEDADRGEADEVSAVIRYLRERQNVLVAAGAQSDKICWDPGLVSERLWNRISSWWRKRAGLLRKGSHS